MNWISALQRLRRERLPGVLVTITDVRGHAPRDAGTKMVVSEAEVWGTIGGGNLEETALDRARSLLDALSDEPSSITISLSDKARTEHGRQCCGGEVGILRRWRHSEDRSWWQWSIEFSNHTGRPDDWAPEQER